MLESADQNLSGDELMVSNYFLRSKDTEKQIMFVTAEDEKIISQKMNLLSNEQLIKQLAGDNINLNTLPEDTKEPFEEIQTFKDIGIDNLKLTGKQKLSQNYFIPVPSTIDLGQDPVIRLKLKTSNTLFQNSDHETNDKKDAELVMYVNEVPHSIAVNELERTSDAAFFEITIPLDKGLLDGESYMSVQFEANGLRDKDTCIPPNNEKWIYIHEDSQLELPLTKTGLGEDLKSWPSPYVSANGVEDTIVLLPNSLDKEVIKQLYTLTSNLGSRAALDGLQLMSGEDADVDVDELSNHHVIVLGDLQEHSSLKGDMDQLILPANNLNELDVSDFGFINETSEYVVWMQPSIWNPDKIMTVFSAVNLDKSGEFLSKGLLEYLADNKIDTNMIVQSKNGEIFTHQFLTVEEEEIHPKMDNEKNNNRMYWFIGVFVFILISGIAIFVYIIRKP